jgi:hypothetical protein
MRVLHEMRRYFTANLKVNLRRSLSIPWNCSGRQNTGGMLEVREGDEETSITSKEYLEDFVPQRARLNRDDDVF